MQIPIVREYRDDILNKNPENQVSQEPFLIETPGAWTRIIAPRHSPFFVDSLKLYFKNGQPMTDEHYEIYKIMPKLTALAGKDVACLIRFKDANIVEGLIDYDVVGEFSLFDSSMWSMMMSSVNDDRPIEFKDLINRPIVYSPELHGHSLMYDVMAFQDTIHLLDSIVKLMEERGRPLIQVKVEHYFSLFNHYLSLYRTMLKEFTDSHVGSYNGHGLNKAQVNLINVDNYATATTMAELMSGRNDLHLTVEGLKTIIDQTGFDEKELLVKDTLPVSQYGNSNFIPPSIDGSFEGLGGMAETLAIAQEDDGNLVVVGNRFDGRVLGLYCSVVRNLQSNQPTCTYSAYRYNHPKFIQDGSLVDRVVNGSNGEAMLVADTTNQRWYIGITNKTMNPARHVYSEIDMGPIKRQFSSTDFRLTDWMAQLSIAVMGDWVYIFFASSRGAPDDLSEEAFGGSLTYRYVYRVSYSGIRNLVKMTPEQVLIDYEDLDGTRRNGSNKFQWAHRVHNGMRTTRFVHTFVPDEDLAARVNYTQNTLITENPNKPGFYVMKFTSYYYCGNGAYGKYTYAFLEASYEVNPNYGTWTKLSQTIPRTIDWQTANLPQDSGDLFTGQSDVLTTGDSKASLVVLDDLTMTGGGALKSTGYPWAPKIYKPQGITSKAELYSRNWRELKYNLATQAIEPVISPLKSGVFPRPVLQFPGKEVYLALAGDGSDYMAQYIKTVSGKYATQNNVINQFIAGIVSRPLTNNIRRLNVPNHIGGALVCTPSADLDRYEMECGLSSFCVGTQRRYGDRTTEGTRWTNSYGLDDVLLIDTHNFIDETNGTTSLAPVNEILYPAAIVNQLKQEVEALASMNSSAKVWVSICDPSGRLTNRFGWLPVIVTVTYAEPVNFSRRITMMSIAPTYTTSGNLRTVTGFTVLDKVHGTVENIASGQFINGWADAWLSGTEGVDKRYNVNSQRCYYYLNGNGLDVYIDPAINSGAFSNVLGVTGVFGYADRTTQRLTTSRIDTSQVNQNQMCNTPDNGIVPAYAYETTTGGAAIITGTVRPTLLASVYPETGWVVFFQSAIEAVFNGKTYQFPIGLMDLRDTAPDPRNKTFYVYALLVDDIPTYEISTTKRLETPFQVWAAKVVTNNLQILTIDRYNSFTINGSRVSEVKRGNSIPASSGLVDSEGQIPWLRSNEMLP